MLVFVEFGVSANLDRPVAGEEGGAAASMELGSATVRVQL